MSERAPVELIHRSRVGAVNGWRPADMAAAPEKRAAAAREHLPTARELEALRESARREGFARGLEEGRRSGAEQARQELLAEHRRQRQRLESVLGALAEPLARLDERVEQEILALVISMARHVIRRELRTSPEEVIGAVREALGQLPVTSRDVRVELHPEDARLVRKRLHDTDEDARWRIVEDPMLQRGGCRVKTDDSLIDATLEARLGALVSQLLGDQRAGTAAQTTGPDAPADAAAPAAGERRGPGPAAEHAPRG